MTAAGSRWSFELRQTLSSRVAELPPPCLNDVVAIIFGEAALIKSGDEFTVDFAKIADAVCAKLEAYVARHLRGDEAPRRKRCAPVSSQSPPSQAAFAAKKKPRAPAAVTVPCAAESELPRQETDLDEEDFAELEDEAMACEPEADLTATATGDVRGALPARVELRRADGRRSECSVVAARDGQHLVLDDAELSLEWICGSARAGTDRNGPAGTVWTHVTRSKPKAREGLVTAPECRELLQWLRRLDVSEPFARPVDAERVPAYAKIVRNPMDLGSIATKLASGAYAVRETAGLGGAAFAADVRLVHANAVCFCERAARGVADSIVYRMAQVLISAFEGRWLELTERGAARCEDAVSDSVTAVREVAEYALSSFAKEQEQDPDSGNAIPAPEELVHRRVEILWERDRAWYAALVGIYRKKDARHRIEYDDGHVEWLDLSQEKFRLVGASAAAQQDETGASKPAGGKKLDQACESDVVSVQKLGIVVWAKSGTHPWWPAELCLPAADKFVETLPPPAPFSSPSDASRSGRKKMVIYFGDTQYDILDTSNVVAFDSRSKPSGKNANLAKACDLANERAASLKMGLR